MPEKVHTQGTNIQMYMDAVCDSCDRLAAIDVNHNSDISLVLPFTELEHKIAM